jgi:hypothetical protein
LLSCINRLLLIFILERARSPPLVHQEEIEQSSGDESSVEGDETILKEFTGTGEYLPGISSKYLGLRV